MLDTCIWIRPLVEQNLDWIIYPVKVFLSRKNSKKKCGSVENRLSQVETTRLVPVVQTFSGETRGSKHSEVSQKCWNKHRKSVSLTYPLGNWWSFKVCYETVLLYTRFYLLISKVVMLKTLAQRWMDGIVNLSWLQTCIFSWIDLELSVLVCIFLLWSLILL